MAVGVLGTAVEAASRTTGKFDGEFVYADAEVPITYALRPATRPDAPLVFVFSGFDSRGGGPYYNYVRTLDPVDDAHRVFVLDDAGARGCYYTGLSGSWDVSRSVERFIEQSAGEHPGAVVMAGSSKGGSAALYFGMRSGHATHIIAGAPQFYIAKYLRRAAPDVADYIGDDAYLDTVIGDAIQDRVGRWPSVRLLTSPGDGQYRKHVLPLTRLLDEVGAPYSLRMGHYRGHGAVGRPFSRYLAASVERIAETPAPAWRQTGDRRSLELSAA